MYQPTWNTGRQWQLGQDVEHDSRGLLVTSLLYMTENSQHIPECIKFHVRYVNISITLAVPVK
jgi:hypothetical protein